MTSKTSACQECGTRYTPAKVGQRFCQTSCSKAFNNRRMTRGAELYDMFMSVRYRRATHAGMLATMSQMANAWREDDKDAREGRESWVVPDLDGDPRAFEITRKAKLARDMASAT